MKRLLTRLALLLAVAGLAGCTGGDSESTRDYPDSPEDATTGDGAQPTEESVIAPTPYGDYGNSTNSTHDNMSVNTTYTPPTG